MALSDILDTGARKNLSVVDTNKEYLTSDEAMWKEHQNDPVKIAPTTSSSKASEDVSNVLLKLGNEYLKLKVTLNLLFWEEVRVTVSFPLSLVFVLEFFCALQLV